jgi:RHS repeat-associated protein
MALAVVYANFGGGIVSESRSSVVRDYMPDPLGSTAALLDGTQTKTDTWEYWPYGEVASRMGTSVTPFTFVGILGYFKDVLDKLFYIRARDLQPHYGRWLTEDPLWPDEPAYAYVHNNPVNLTDPNGLSGGDLDELAAATASIPGVGVIVAGACSSRPWNPFDSCSKFKDPAKALCCVATMPMCGGLPFGASTECSAAVVAWCVNHRKGRGLRWNFCKASEGLDCDECCAKACATWQDSGNGFDICNTQCNKWCGWN